jgi:hypothetical protein
MMALSNLSNSLSDVMGSFLFDHYQLSFMNLVWVNAGSTALVLLVIPLLPGFLINRKEGDASVDDRHSEGSSTPVS